MTAPMEETIPVSVVVVSLNRPGHLRRCLGSLDQQFYHPFEVIVVADQVGRAALGGFADRAKVIPCDGVNRAIAYNQGIAAAAGDVVAFLDGDAVAEPTWLTHLVAPFAANRVAAAAGWVRGSDGIAFRTQSRMVNRFGQHEAVAHKGHDPLLMPGRTGLAARTEATNMAWRRTALELLGGFNSAYQGEFSTRDLNLRLAARGGMTALVPLAQVHDHNATWAEQVPSSLSEVGADWALLLERHARGDPAALADARRSERGRLVRHAIAGATWPWMVRRRLAEFDAGAEAGSMRADSFPEGHSTPPPFRPWHATSPDVSSVTVSGSWFARRRLRGQAVKARADGSRVTVVCLSPTTRRHSLRFDEEGIWVYRGGTYGRADRAEVFFTPTTRAKRTARVLNTLSDLRRFTDVKASAPDRRLPPEADSPRNTQNPTPSK